MQTRIWKWNEMKFCVCVYVFGSECHHQYGKREKKKYHYRPPELFTWIKHFFYSPDFVVFVYFISFALSLSFSPLFCHSSMGARLNGTRHQRVNIAGDQETTKKPGKNFWQSAKEREKMESEWVWGTKRKKKRNYSSIFLYCVFSLYTCDDSRSSHLFR